MVDVKNNYITLESNMFSYVEPVSYTLNGSEGVSVKDWGMLFKSVLKYYLCIDYTKFISILTKGIFALDSNPVVSSNSLKIKNGINIGSNIFVATDGLDGKTVQCYLELFFEEWGISKDTLKIEVTTKKVVIPPKVLNGGVVVEESLNCFSISPTEGVLFSGVIDDGALTVSVVVEPKEVVKEVVKEVNYAYIDLNIRNWGNYEPCSFMYKDNVSKVVKNWEDLAYCLMSEFTSNYQDKGVLNKIIKNKLAYGLDEKCLSTATKQLYKPMAIGGGFYIAESVYKQPMVLRHLLLLLFKVFYIDVTALKIKVKIKE